MINMSASRNLRKLLIIGVRVLTLLVLATSCTTKVPSPQSGTGVPYRIGVIVSRTGNYAGLGEPQMVGAVLAAEHINNLGGVNGHPIQLIIEDDEGSADKAVSLARKLISEDEVVAIFGPTPVVAARAVAEVAEQLQVPLIAPVPNREVVAGRQYAFHISLPSDLVAEGVTVFLSDDLSWHTVAIMHANTAYGIDLAHSIQQTLEAEGSEVILYTFTPADLEFRPILLRVSEDDPDGIILIDTTPAAPASALQTLRDLGMRTPVFGPSPLATRNFLDLAGDAAEGMYVQASFHYGVPTPQERELFGALAAYAPGELPRHYHGIGWDAIHLLAEAMREGGDNPSHVKEALETIQGFEGTVGTYYFSETNHNGHVGPDMTIIRIQQGEFVFVRDFHEKRGE